MSRIVLTGLSILLVLTACSTGAARTDVRAAPSRTVTVFAAASLNEAFSEIGKAFEAGHPGVNVIFNFAGSPTLRTQIEQGAQADVFASADETNMQQLASEKMVNISHIFTRNQLIVILPPNNPAGISKLQDLARPGLKLVLAGENVPAGKYARQMLEQMDTAYGASFEDKALANVASNEEDVKQVVAKVQLGEADAGIVYTSDAIAAPELKTIEIPAGLNVVAQYPIASLNNSPNATLADEFIAYILSIDGQVILKKWGFLPA